MPNSALATTFGFQFWSPPLRLRQAVCPWQPESGCDGGPQTLSPDWNLRHRYGLARGDAEATRHAGYWLGRICLPANVGFFDVAGNHGLTALRRDQPEAAARPCRGRQRDFARQSGAGIRS